MPATLPRLWYPAPATPTPPTRTSSSQRTWETASAAAAVPLSASPARPFREPPRDGTPLELAHGCSPRVDRCDLVIHADSWASAGTPLLAQAAGVAGADHDAAALLDPSPVSERTMLAVESARCREVTRALRELHPGEGPIRAVPIGLCLSGGGTRAAAFHCGVLWALASGGILKDVAHLAATSGGGYTAASVMTHLYQMSAEAESAKSLDVWYRQVVMRTVLRMQHNISYLVETTPDRLLRMPEHDRPEEAGASLGPRIFDLPLLVGALLGSMLVSPVMLVVHTVWPIILHIELFHGSRLRSAWCDPRRSPWDDHAVTEWLWSSVSMTAGWAVACIVLHSIGRLGCCQPHASRPLRYLACRSARQVVARGGVVYIAYVLLVLAILWMQVQHLGSAAGFGGVAADGNMHEERRAVRTACQRYVQAATSAGAASCSDRTPPRSAGRAAMAAILGLGDGGIDGVTLWYGGPGAASYFNATWTARHASADSSRAWRSAGSQDEPLSLGEALRRMSLATVGISGLVLVGAFALLIRSTLVKWVLTLAIPLGYVLIVASVARWVIFGPITGQPLLPGTAMAYTPELAWRAFAICLAAALTTLPVYDAFLKLLHLYYRRALRRAFFHGGRDVSVGSLVTSPYCPNLLLGACLHDYRPPGEDANFCFFTISSFFLGCRRTGFFYTPSQARLAHVLTVAGAATDASLLISLDILFIRILLAALSLKFGDFLRLEPDGETAVRVSQRLRSGALRAGKVVNKILPPGLRKFAPLRPEDHDQHCMQRWLQGLLDRLPAACPFIICQLLLLVSVLNGHVSVPLSANPVDGRRSLQEACRVHDVALLVCYALLYTTLALSFFGFWRPLQFLIRSPMVQQLQMMAMHVYVAPRPPPYLYVSDGGLLEVLGILPLLRRRLKKIVVSDAAEDPLLSMRCLRDAAALARKERICSFFDPNDPRRDLEFVLQDLPRSRQACLHLGIRYEPREDDPDGDGEVEVGELFYVRMRLLPGDCEPVRSLLTPEELLRPPRPSANAPEPGAGERRHLGGTCWPWCECGGLLAGRQFPHYNMGNQFLTPLHFANLCGLAAELSQPLIGALRGVPELPGSRGGDVAP